MHMSVGFGLMVEVAFIRLGPPIVVIATAASLTANDASYGDGGKVTGRLSRLVVRTHCTCDVLCSVGSQSAHMPRSQLEVAQCEHAHPLDARHCAQST
jgi:hypothetical protein